MSYRKLIVPVFVAAAGIAALVGSLAIADAAKETAPAGQPEMKLPPGWTMDDMKACMLAATEYRLGPRCAAARQYAAMALQFHEQAKALGANESDGVSEDKMIAVRLLLAEIAPWRE